MSPLALETDEKDACTIGRKGVRHGGVEIITRGGRRRIWTLEQQREIGAESLGLELTPTEVARKPAISSGLFYTWRPQFMGGQTSVSPDLRRVLPGLSCPCDAAAKQRRSCGGADRSDAAGTTAASSGGADRNRAALRRIGARGC
jgi:hypothetical protein